MAADIDAFDVNFTGGGAAPFHHFQGGDFAGTVVAQDAKGFTRLDGKRDAVDRSQWSRGFVRALT